MAMNILNKLRTELYKVSEFEDCEYEHEIKLENSKQDNKAILVFLDKARGIREKSEYEIIDNFEKTLVCDTKLMLKSIFYLRDVKYGLGERRVFRVIINYLAINMPEVIIELLPIIPKYGRFDDYYSLFNTPLEKDVIKLFKIQINSDLNSKKPSTLAKWLKSENTSSRNSRKLGVKTRNLMGYTSQEYRLILSLLRKRISVMEQNNSESALKLDLPINIIDTMVKRKDLYGSNKKHIHEDTWKKSLNGYKANFEDTFVLVSISKVTKNEITDVFKAGISSILFYNKLNLGVYKDYYMYFNPKPHFSKIETTGVVDGVKHLKDMCFHNGNAIEAGLDLLLFTSIKKNLSNQEMPKNILIISDCDLELKYKDSNNVQLIKNKWGLSGYVMPKLKFWQIEKCSTSKKISKDIYSNIFARGYSQEVFDSIFRSEVCGGDELLLQKLLGDRYSEIL